MLQMGELASSFESQADRESDRRYPGIEGVVFGF